MSALAKPLVQLRAVRLFATFSNKCVTFAPQLYAFKEQSRSFKFSLGVLAVEFPVGCLVGTPESYTLSDDGTESPDLLTRTMAQTY